MNFVEVTNWVSHSNKIVPVNEVSKHIKKDGVGFRSLFLYTEDFKNYVEKNNTTENYDGDHFADYLIFDFDGKPEMFDEVKKETWRFCQFLIQVCEVDYESIYVAFSGNKGFHVAIPFNVVTEEVEFRKDFYQVYRRYVEELTKGFKFIDLGIYNPVRIFRITNTKHNETNLFKIPLDIEELSDEKLNIKTLAKKPRTMERTLPNEFGVCDYLNRIWNLVSKLEVKEKEEKLKEHNAFQIALSSQPEVGGRHDALTKIVGYLIDRNVGMSEALAICRNWDKQLSDPLGDRLEIDVKGIYKSYWDKRPQAKQIEEVSFEELLVYGSKYTDVYDRHIDRISQFGRVKTGYPIIDQPMRGMIAGEVGVVVGKTSVGKSAFVQNLALNNVEAGRRILFFSLEMPIETVTERNLQMLLGRSGQHIEELRQQGHQFIIDDIEKANNTLDNFATIATQGIQYNLIEDYIKRTEDYFGEKLDIVLIDYAGLIKFEGGSLYEQQSGIARDLKALSQRTMTSIITLSQVSKNYKETDPLDLDSTRDSGVVVEASDYVIGLWRSNRYNPEAVELDGSLLKNRNGSRADFSAHFSRKSLRYTLETRIVNEVPEREEELEF